MKAVISIPAPNGMFMSEVTLASACVSSSILGIASITLPPHEEVHFIAPADLSMQAMLQPSIMFSVCFKFAFPCTH